ncbi:hypothetical protein BDV12DRAFT_173341 [Aspergillus spectabilis]
MGTNSLMTGLLAIAIILPSLITAAWTRHLYNTQPETTAVQETKIDICGRPVEPPSHFRFATVVDPVLMSMAGRPRVASTSYRTVLLWRSSSSATIA